MSYIGFYRHKFTPQTSGTATSTIYINNVPVSKTVEVVNKCTSELLIKFLDTNGQYRFVVFGKQYRGELKTKMIGKTSDFVANILTAETNQRNVGFESSKEITVTKDIENRCLPIYEMLAVSPRVYMSTGTDTWQEIIIQAGTFTFKRSKGNSGVVNFTFEYPKQYNIGLL